MKNFAIIGFGGLGKTHFLKLLKLEKERGDICLKSICNNDLSTITKSMSINIGDISMEGIDFSRFNLYSDYKEMVAKEKLDLVFVTLPSYLHSQVCVYLLNNNIDVYVEKPMAINLEECKKMVDAAKNNNKKLMVGQCSRFTDEYVFLKNIIEQNTYGKPIKAEFVRKSPLPSWSFDNWMLDETRSGGCIVDMHVHDLDIMIWLFGMPEKTEVLSSHQMASYESVFALYKYPNLNVSILTDWGIHASFKFKYSYAVTFENAYVECINGKIIIYTNEKSFKPNYPKTDYLYNEECEFVSAVVDDKQLKTTDINSVYEMMKLLFLEKERGM